MKSTTANNEFFDNKKIPIGDVKLGNALHCNQIFKNKIFDCIITSPPYLNIFSYTSEN